MSQKEKAEDLLSKYYFQVQTLAEQKQCALIVADEFISYFSEEGFKMAYPEIAIREIEYWNGVKQEIEKLNK